MPSILTRPSGGGGAGGSISVTFYSDAGLTTPITEPKFDQVIYVKATASGGTPTSYEFQLPQSDGHYAYVTQVSDTYAWTCQAVGEFTVTVVADFGSSKVAASADGEQIGDVDAQVFIDKHELNTSASMGAVQKAAIAGLYIRFKGHLTTGSSNLLSVYQAESSVVLPFCPTDDSTATIAGYQINMIDPANDVTFVNMLPANITVYGVKNDSQSKYIGSGISPSDFGQDDVGFDLYCREDISSFGRAIHAQNNTYWGYSKWNNTAYFAVNTTGQITAGNTDARGFYTYDRISSGEILVKKNGAILARPLIASIAPSTNEIRMLNGNGLDPRQYAWLTAGRPSLNEQQLLDLNEIVQWYQTNVITGGRNV